MSAVKENRLYWILVGVLTAAGLALRLAYMLKVPPFLDEYSSMLTGMSILRTGGIPLLPSGVLYPSGSLFSYLEAAFLGLLGFSDAVARLPSLLTGGLTLIVLYLVTQKMLNRRAALLSVALLAFMPEAIIWGGRARMYALLQLLTLLVVYFFYAAVMDIQSDGETRSRNPSWVWVICFLAAIFSQDEAILLLPLLWLAALAVRGIRWFLRPGVVVGQVLLPLGGVGIR
jgi:predicted membrane-bound mannosyltransferase